MQTPPLATYRQEYAAGTAAEKLWAEGFAEGYAKSYAKAMAKNLILILQSRFEAVTSEVVERIYTLDQSEIECLIPKAAVVLSLDALFDVADANDSTSA